MRKETETQAAFERIAAIFIAFVCAISLLAVTGWLFNQPVLASLRPEFLPMAPSTALIFLGLCATWFIHRNLSARRGMRILEQASLLGLLIIILILAFRVLTGHGPDLEQWLYPNPPLFGEIPSARMSPLVAMGFFLAIEAFLLMTGHASGKRTKSASAVLSLVVFILSGFILIGYLYGAPPFYGGTLIPVAITTAISFSFLSLGLLMTAGPACWPLRVFVGPSLKARLMRAFIPASMLIVLIQGLLSTAPAPWIVNPPLRVAVAALVALLIVIFSISLIANNLSAEIERGKLARIQAESTLKQSEAHFRDLYENTTIGMYCTTPDGHILMANPTLVSMLGYKSIEELSQRDLATEDYEPEYLRREFQERIEREGKVRGLESIWKRKDGSTIYVRESAHLARNENNQPLYYEGTVEDITERKQVEEDLRVSEERYRQLVERTPNGILIHVDGQIVFANSAGAKILGLAAPEDLVGKQLLDFVHPDYQKIVKGRVKQVTENKKEVPLIEEKLIRLDGTVIDAEVTAIPFIYKKRNGVQVVFNDTTQRRRFELVQNAIFRITQASITSDGIDALYHSIHSILGELIPAENFYIALYDSANGLLSFPYYIDQFDEPPTAPTQIQGLTGYVIRNGRPLLATREIFDRLVQQGEVEAVGTVGVDWMGAPLKVEGRMIGVMAVQSYTEGIHFDQEDLNLLEFVSTQVAQAIERKRMEQEILSLSLTDELTGLYNRRGFTLLAEQELKQAHRIKKSMLLFFGDVDDLKAINDTHGHAQGDLALKEVAAILKETFREADTPARIGGDEFVVLVVDASRESADILTNRIQDTLERRNQQGDRPYHLTLSVGIAGYDPEAPCTVSELIAQADGLMYQQKQAGKGKK